MKSILTAICCAALISTTASAQMVTGTKEGMTNDAGNAGATTKKAKAKTSKAKRGRTSKQN